MPVALESFSTFCYTPDINLPDLSGMDLCKTILSEYSSMKILALSSFTDRSIIKMMLKMGAYGYLIKNASDDEILKAVKTVIEGKKVPLNSNHLTQEEMNSHADLPYITAREREVLQLIAEGLTNNAIAEKIFVSPLTVDSHRKNLLLKLGAANTAVLVKIGIEKGFISFKKNDYPFNKIN